MLGKSAILGMGFLLAAAASFAQQVATPTWKEPSVKGVKSPLAGKPKFHEDWNTITLEKSTLVAEVPVPGNKVDLPGNNFIREIYQLEWRPGDPLDLYVIRPKDVKHPPVILYLYSTPQDTERFKSDHWCGSTTANGYAAVGFVSALTGHRTEHRPPKEWFVSELQEALATSTHDVQMILNYLANRGDLDMNRVGMFGQGSGGAIAILASAADERIKALDVLTPWGDWPDFFKESKILQDEERAKYTAAEFLGKVAGLEPKVWLPKVKARSVRIQNVRQDGVVPDAVQERIEAAAPEIAAINQFGDGKALVPAAAGGRLLEWLKSQLTTDAKPGVAVTQAERVHFYPAKSEPIR